MKPRSVACLLCVSALLSPLAAMAESVWTSDDAALRAGPDQGYPRIDTIPAGSRLELYGCVNDWSWCDVDTGYDRGWVSSGLLDSEWRGQRVDLYDYGPQLGFPVVTFVFGSYWDRYYRDRGWYRERNRWAAYRPVYHPPRPRPMPPRPPRDDTSPRPPRVSSPLPPDMQPRPGPGRDGYRPRPPGPIGNVGNGEDRGRPRPDWRTRPAPIPAPMAPRPGDTRERVQPRSERFTRPVSTPEGPPRAGPGMSRPAPPQTRMTTPPRPQAQGAGPGPGPGGRPAHRPGGRDDAEERGRR